MWSVRARRTNNKPLFFSSLLKLTLDFWSLEFPVSTWMQHLSDIQYRKQVSDLSPHFLWQKWLPVISIYTISIKWTKTLILQICMKCYAKIKSIYSCVSETHLCARHTFHFIQTFFPEWIRFGSALRCNELRALLSATLARHQMIKQYACSTRYCMQQTRWVGPSSTERC